MYAPLQIFRALKIVQRLDSWLTRPRVQVTLFSVVLLYTWLILLSGTANA